MERQERSVTIVNRNYPPGQGVTGESSAELAKFLIGKGVAVNVVHILATYPGGAAVDEQVGNVFKLRTFYNGKNKFLRLLGNIYEGYVLISKAQRLRSDLIICLTDPPLLNFWAALLLKGGSKWMLWSMDLYPEAFAAGRLVSRSNLLYRLVDKMLVQSQPDHIISLGRFQTEYLRKKYSPGISITELPCGIFDLEKQSEKFRPAWAQDISKIYLGYCGNLGEAHSFEFISAVIENLNTEKVSLILSVYGSQSARLLSMAKDKPGVQIVDTVRRSELKYIDVHIASLVKDWVNVSVPSKTVSSVCAGSAFLYHGIENSDNWGLLKDAGWLISDDDLTDQVKLFLSTITKEAIAEKKARAIGLGKRLKELKEKAFLEIYEKIVELTTYEALPANSFRK